MLPKQQLQTRACAYYFIATQTALILTVVGILGLLGLFEIAYSAFLGGLVCVAANIGCIRRTFPMTHKPRQIVNQLYLGEALKWLITFALFGLIIKFVQPIMFPFFAMYITTYMVAWLTPF